MEKMAGPNCIDAYREDNLELTQICHSLVWSMVKQSSIKKSGQISYQNVDI